MKHTYLTCGKIVSTHGVRGAVKAEPWCDSPAVLAGYDRVYFREGDTYTPRAVRGAFVSGRQVVLTLEGVTDMESGRVRHIVIGIGLNCGTEPFPPELREIAASIDRRGVSRSRFVAAMVTELVACIEGRDFMDDYRARSCVLGKKINCIKNGVVTPAEALAIDDDGALIVRLEDGSWQRLNTGEISVRTRE